MRASTLALVIAATTLACNRRASEPTLSAVGQTPNATPAASRSDVGALLARLHDDAVTQARIAEIAASRAHAPEVKQYADTLGAEHRALDERVIAYVQSHGIDLPGRAPVASRRRSYGSGDPGAEAAATRTGHSPEQKIERIRELGVSPRTDFDRDFLAFTIEDHAEQAHALEAAQPRDADADLRALTTDALAMVKRHQATAQQLLASTASAPAAQGRRRR